MRDPAELVTAELPTIEPPPPPAPKEPTAAERRLICAYQDPKSVRSCRNCRHRQDVLQGTGGVCESFTVRCRKHAFPVQLGALCADHEEGPTGAHSSQH